MNEVSLINLQPLLTPAKGNPDFTVCSQPNSPEVVFVYYGLALIEKVRWSLESLEFKMLLARLYNAKANLKELVKTFHVAHTTLGRWGRALKSGDLEQITRAFSGQGPEKKLTEDVVSYVRCRFHEIYVTNRYNYSQIIRKEIRNHFQKEISSESLRKLFKEEKEKFANGQLSEPEEESSKPSGQDVGSDSIDVSESGSCSVVSEAARMESETVSLVVADGGKESDTRAISCDLSGNSSLFLPNNRNYSLIKEKEEGIMFSGDSLPDYPYICHHAGLILFSVLLDRVLGSSYSEKRASDDKMKIAGLLEPGKEDGTGSINEDGDEEEPRCEIQVVGEKEQMRSTPAEVSGGSSRAPGLEDRELSSSSRIAKHPIVRQWFASILLGSVNHEQSKKLCFKDLELLVGPQIKSLNHQRKLLGKLANETTTQTLYRHNGCLLDLEKESDFYYDPQGEEYTGQLKLLKGWCGRRGRVTKILYNDFIHCSNGWPAYTKPWDSYYDMRDRFFPTITEFRRVFGIENRTCTWIMDRGIYSLCVFQQIKDSQTDHFITWEKDFKGGCWDESKKSGDYTLYRCRNDSDDIQTYKFHYMDGVWSRDSEIRRLIVKPETRSGRSSIELSILTDDTTRLASSIILLMFQRWLQENDFRYSILHVGINELTSRSYMSYRELKTELEDRNVESDQHKSLKKKKQKLTGEFGKLLVSREQDLVRYKKAYRLIEDQIVTLNKSINNSPGTDPTKKTCRFGEEHRQLIAKQKRLTTNHEKKQKTVNTKITKLTETLDQVEQKLLETKEKVSRLELLEKEGYKRLDTRRKAFYDAIRISCRNIFFTLLGDFRPRYNNYRDDHVLLRELTRSPGVLVKRKTTIEIYLKPAMHYQPKTKKVVKEFLQKITDDINQHFGRRYYKIRIQLLENQAHWFNDGGPSLSART